MICLLETPQTTATKNQRKNLLFFRRQSQAKHRLHSLSCYIHLRLARMRQVQGFAVLATIDFGVRPHRLLDVPTFALDRVLCIGPELQVSAAELSLLIFFVAGALSRLLDFDFVLGKLRDLFGTGTGNFACRQRTYPRSSGQQRRRIRLNALIVTEEEAAWPLPSYYP